MDKNFSRDASRFTHMERGFGGYCLRAVLASCLALAVLTGPSLAWAGDKGQENAHHHRLINHQRLHELKERISDLRERMKEHRHHQHNVASSTTTDSVESLQAKVASLESSVAALLSADSTLLTNLQAAQTQIQTMQAQIAALEARPAGGGGGVPGLEKYLFIETGDKNNLAGPHIVFRGVNVHVQNGQNSTVVKNGLGNLIIGYDESPSGGMGVNRTGSHNLVGGQFNAFSSWGGLVLGSNNALHGQFSAILGGQNNTVNSSAWYSTIYGATGNTAMGQYEYLPAPSVPGN